MIGLVTQALALLAALLGTAGYVYLLGAAVLWWRLNDAGLPTEVVLATATRAEVVVTGAETLAIWAVLAVMFGALVYTAFGRWWPGYTQSFISAALGIGAGYTTLAIAEGKTWYLAALVAVLAVAALATGHLRPPGHWLVPTSIWVVVGTASGFAVSWLVDNDQRTETLGGAWLILLSLFGIALLLRSSWREREQGVASLADVEAEAARLSIEIGRARRANEPIAVLARLRRRRATMEALAADLRARLRIPLAPSQRVVWRWWRWAALAAFALLLLGGVAVASKLDAAKDFDTAIVALDDGSCLTGTYIARDDKRLLLANHPRVVAIPGDRVTELQVGAPETSASTLMPEDCKEKIVLPTSQKQGAGSSGGGGGGSASAGKDGATGATGPAGPRGATGPGGPRGATGAAGVQGATGPEGPQGDDGPRGPRGRDGRAGRDGRTGRDGRDAPRRRG